MAGLTNYENTLYQLSTLASYEKEDLDSSTFEVAYEVGGCDSFAEVSCIDVAADTLELIDGLEGEIESLKSQLEAQSKTPSHWETAPEGAVKLVNCNGYHIYLNSNDEYFDCEIGCWNKDSNPEDNTLIDERTL